jgi:riboflavin kinase / FMN adenylyltransferase
VNLIRNLDHLPDCLRGGAVSIGNFDGVHRGHARIAERLIALARRIGGAAIVFTFDPHPARILRPQQAPPPLCWLERKAELLAKLGVDAVVAYPTSEEFLRLDARQFFHQIVRDRLAARGLVEGRNFFFGHHRSGTIDVLQGLCTESGIPLEVIDPVEIDGQAVSSSRVRGLVAAGRLDEVRAMLTQPYRIHGTVVRGVGRGNRLGYPTANVDHIDLLLPGEGIYAGRAWIGGSAQAPLSRVRAAAISIGSNPTFDEAALKVEAYLLDFEGDLYDQPIEVDFLARLRKIKRFDTAGQLVAQMAHDVEATRRINAEDNKSRSGDGRHETEMSNAQCLMPNRQPSNP